MVTILNNIVINTSNFKKIFLDQTHKQYEIHDTIDTKQVNLVISKRKQIIAIETDYPSGQAFNNSYSF